MNNLTLKKEMLILPVNLFLLLTAAFFLPLEVYLGNYSEFTFAWKNVWQIMLAFSLLSVGALSLLECLIPEKICNFILRLSVAGGICIYAQSMFMNGQLQELTGESITFSSKTVLANSLLWLFIICMVFSLLLLTDKKAGRKKHNELMIFLSVAMIVIQLSGFITSSAQIVHDQPSKDLYLSTEGEFDLSDGNNVVFFILDTCDKEYVDEALREDPTLFDAFTGFISYTNAIATYSRTYPALPYLMTHEKCFFDIPYRDYINNAFDKSEYLDSIHSHGTDIKIYTSMEYFPEESYQLLDNVSSYDSTALSTVSVPGLIKAMLRLGGYKEMPYLLKPVFSYTIDPINRNVLQSPPEDYFTLTNNDFDFFERLSDKRVSVSSSVPASFRLYHLFGPHPGCYMNANAQYDADASQTDALRGDIKIITQYIDDLKALGVYDNTTIIVTADHGNQNESEDFLLHDPVCCIMLVKEAGADSSEKIRYSTAPVSQENLFAAVLNAFGIEASQYPPAISAVSESADAERYYYYTAQSSWEDGEVALREYRIKGDANVFSNWELTGNYWDIRYSANAVSKQRLSGMNGI